MYRRTSLKKIDAPVKHVKYGARETRHYWFSFQKSQPFKLTMNKKGLKPCFAWFQAFDY